MQLAPTPPLPAALKLTPVQPAFDLDRDAESHALPQRLQDAVRLPIASTATWGDDGEWPIEDWFAAPSTMEQPMRMTRSGVAAAIAGANLLAERTGMPVAVVQDAADGARWLVPMGVWNPVDESELSFDDAGGLPYWNGAADHVLVGRAASKQPADVEALVFRDGDASRWVNLTGHPVRT